MQSSFYADHSLGYVQFAAGSLATAQLLNPPVGTTGIAIKCEAQAVRFTDDGTTPNATQGFPLAVGETLNYESSSMPQLRFIQQTAGAILNVIFYGQRV